MRVLRRQQGHFDWHEFRTSWPAGLLGDLAALKGEWFCDSYARFEHPLVTQQCCTAGRDSHSAIDQT